MELELWRKQRTQSDNQREEVGNLLEHARQDSEKMKKLSYSTDVPKQKERHIVSWSEEEDDILREQIQLHGTENWAIIASKFKDKTTRQCRRRWFTYLNSDFKKGGWSPEEDMLLCEAQKQYGNRWTEIAKVVSGRTDNAVKNRFTTLCKKRAKREALAKENAGPSYLNLNNKRVIFRTVDGASDSHKKMRGEKFAGDCFVADSIRPPLAVISQTAQSCDVNFPTRMYVSKIKEGLTNGSRDNNTRQTFIRKDDPKMIALIQQEELLSSLAVKVNTENTDQSLESAWMVVQDFLEQNKDSELLKHRYSDADFEVEKLKELRRCGDADEYVSSPASSEYSSGAEICVLNSAQPDSHFPAGKNAICHAESTNEEFSSPVRVTSLFRALAAAVPSPKFSDSEKHFLMKTLGMESTSPNSVQSSGIPHCKRSLLHCL